MKMAFAIFWLPLVAGLLLGGLAVGAWYGGDRTLAVWTGFVGAVFFLLTAALQLQQFVWMVTNQPQVAVEPDRSKPSYIKWDPPHNFGIMPITDLSARQGTWKVPEIIIRNGGVVAQDATIKWGVTPFDREALAKASPRLTEAAISFPDKDRMILAPKNGGSGFIHDFSWTASLPLPFIGRQTMTFIPLAIWDNAALFFVATMPDGPDAVSQPFFIDAQISWNIPEGGQPKRFRITARAKNVAIATPDSPKYLAQIELNVAPEP